MADKQDNTTLTAQGHQVDNHREILDELWERLAAIEKVWLSIPVNYTPNSRVIPRESNRGKVYSVLATPWEQIEAVFQDVSLRLTQQTATKPKAKKHRL